MMDLLYENDIVLESQGDKKSLIRRMLDKIKEFIKKLKNWVNSIIKKKENIDKEQSKNTNTQQEQTEEETGDVDGYNKTIENQTLICEVIDSDKIITEFNKILSILENIIGNILSRHSNRDVIEQMFESISEHPNFKSFKIKKSFKLKDFISSKDLEGSYHLRVPILYFKNEFSSSMGNMYESTNRVHNLISDSIEKVNEPEQIAYLQKCTSILGQVSRVVSDELGKILYQCNVLQPKIRSYEATLRKKYNLK